MDYSNLNNEKKGLDDGGESGQTFKGMMDWVDRTQPPVVILENVCGAPWDLIAQRWNQHGKDIIKNFFRIFLFLFFYFFL